MTDPAIETGGDGSTSQTAGSRAERAPDRSRLAMIALVGNLVLQALSFASGLLAGRVLGPSGRGELSVIQTVPTLLASLGMLGVQEAVVYFAARREQEPRAVVGTGLSLVTRGSVVAMAVGVPIVLLAASQMPDDVRSAALVNLLLCPVLAVFTVSYQPLRALGDYLRWTLFRVALAGGWVATLVAGAIYGDPDAAHVALAYLAFQAVLAVVALAFIRHKVGALKSERKLRRPLLRFGLPNAVANVPQVANARLDQVLIGVFLPSRELGLYVVAVGWSMIMLPVLNSIASLLFPRIAGLDGDVRVAEAARGLRVSVGLAVAQTAAGVLATLVAFPVMLGSSYSDAVPVAMVLVVAGSLYGLNVVAEEIHRGLGSARPILRAELLGLVVSVGGLLVLIRSTGIMGAAWISVAAYGVVFVDLVRALLRITKARARDVLIPRWGEMVGLRSLFGRDR